MGKIIRFLILIPVLFLYQNCGSFEGSENQIGRLSSEGQNRNGIIGMLKASDFVDTRENNSLMVEDSLFNIEESSGILYFSTQSNLDNIHSHYSLGRDLTSYEYSGAMRFSSMSSGVGVTFLSDYPVSDNYYRIYRDEESQSFRLSSRHANSCLQTDIDSLLTPIANTWYSYKVSVVVEDSYTKIEAKIWPSFSSEPFSPQISCLDMSNQRRTRGTFGLWAGGSGIKDWANLGVFYNPALPVAPNNSGADCGMLADGASETRVKYQNTSVSSGSSCVAETQVRTCDNGMLSDFTPNNFQYDVCIEEPDNSTLIPITSVTASSTDAADPNLVVDGDLSTFWSAQGEGEYLELSFDGVYNVSTIEIGFYRGNLRNADFELQVLNGSSWTSIFSGTNTTRTLDLVPFNIDTSLSSSQIRIVGYGNSENLWHSIAEVVVRGEKVDDIPDMEPQSCGPIADGQSENRTRYLASTVVAPEICQFQVQTRTCLDGSLGQWLPNNYLNTSCTVMNNSNLGWTAITPSPDTRVIYVSASEGSDSNNGLSMSAPKRSIAAGLSLLRDGFPDHLLLKRGDTWTNENFGRFEKSGRSNQERMVISTYGTGNRPLLKIGTNYGIWLQGGSNLIFKGFHLYAHTRDWRSNEYVSVEGSRGFRALGSTNNVLLEDIKVQATNGGISFQGNIASPSQNIAVRRSIIIDTYATDTHGSGFYTYGVNGLLLEDNFIDHNGFGASRDLPKLQGGATVFNQNIYVDNEGVSNVRVIGNIIARAAHHGIQLRSGGEIRENSFLKNPLDLMFGGGDNHTVYNPNGVTGSVSNNVMIEGGDVTTNLRRGISIWLENIGQAEVNNNYVLKSATDPINDYGIRILSEISPSGNVNITNNVMYQWVRGGVTLMGRLGQFGTITKNNNYYWDMPAEGTNRNIQTDNVQFVDASRNLASYYQNILGGSGYTFDKMSQFYRDRGCEEWSDRYSSKNINDYFREGFTPSN